MTSNLKKLLVPIDLSEASFNAWRQAVELAEPRRALIEIVHVLSTRSQFFPGNPPTQALAEARRNALSHIRDKVGDKARIHCVQGDPVKIILRLAKDRNPDMIVMGTHGRAGLKRFILGSVAEAVIEKSPVPVLTVRGESRPISAILAPVAFTHYSMLGFASAAKLAAALESKITALHVAEPGVKTAEPNALLEQLIRKLPPSVRKDCRPQTHFVKGDPAEAILRVADLHDMIVLTFHRKSPVKDWALGTTVQRVLRRASIPVLSVPYMDPASPKRRKLLQEIFAR